MASTPPTDPDRRLSHETVTAITKEFLCPICLEVIQKCTVVKECLHRFCWVCFFHCSVTYYFICPCDSPKDCVCRSMRLGGKKACPSCRASLRSTRDLERDIRFDQLIATVLSNVDEARTLMDAEAARAAAELDLASLQAEMREAMERQLEIKGIKLVCPK